MKRILLMVLKCFYYVPFWLAKLCRFGKDENFEKYPLLERYQYVQNIVDHANRSGHVTIVSSGEENIPAENGFVMYPNHQGMYDMLAIINTLDRPFSVIFKKEVENVILIKQLKVAMHYIPMDRADLKQSGKVIIEVIKRVKAGENFVIFAEGTRSRNGNEILPFKAGSFKAATKAKAPIVPVALINSYEPFDSHSTKPVTVQIHYLKPMLYEEYGQMDTAEIALEVEKRIRAAIMSHND